MRVRVIFVKNVIEQMLPHAGNVIEHEIVITAAKQKVTKLNALI